MRARRSARWLSGRGSFALSVGTAVTSVPASSSLAAATDCSSVAGRLKFPSARANHHLFASTHPYGYYHTLTIYACTMRDTWGQLGHMTGS
jgi:hypothetical protein